MKKVLAITMALLLASIIMSPAVGYSFKSENATLSYSNAIGAKVNYSINAGTPAHELTAEQMSVTSKAPGYSISATKVPYSIKTGAAVRYSVQAGTPNETSANQGEAAAPVASENVTAAEAAPTETAAPTAYSISGTAYDDAEGNAAKEAGEAGVAGVVVDLAQPAGTTIANTTTDANGDYTFSDLAAGEYTVSAVAPDGWKLTAPAEGSYAVVISNANEVAKDFGLQRIVVPVETNATAENTTAVENLNATSTESLNASAVTMPPAGNETAINATSSA